MSWASRRQFLIISLVAAVLLAIIAVITIAIVYETPTCSDGKQNADETGVDCGGSCTYQCLAEVDLPATRFVRAFSPQEGRYDVIAYVDNRNASLAAKNVRASIEVFDTERLFLGRKEVTFDIPAGSTVPLYVPEVYRGPNTVAQAFLIFEEDTLKFFAPSEEHVVPLVTNVVVSNEASPRIRATVENPTALPLYDIRPIATVFDGEGNAIAASQTFLPQLGGQAQASVLFTWNRAFVRVPARVEVLPVLPVSAP